MSTWSPHGCSTRCRVDETRASPAFLLVPWSLSRDHGGEELLLNPKRHENVHEERHKFSQCKHFGGNMITLFYHLVRAPLALPGTLLLILAELPTLSTTFGIHMVNSTSQSPQEFVTCLSFSGLPLLQIQFQFAPPAFNGVEIRRALWILGCPREEHMSEIHPPGNKLNYSFARVFFPTPSPFKQC